MTLFRRLFGGRESANTDPRAVLEEARGDERRLRHAGTRHRDAFRHGGSLHDAYRAAWRDTHGAAPATPASGAGGELEALEQLEREPDVAAVLVGDVDILVRRSFLLDLMAHDDISDAHDVVPELTDMANARGFRVTFVPG